MDFFELMGAMKAKAPVITKIVNPSYETVIVGTVCGISYRMNQEGEILEQAELMDRRSKRITVVPCNKVERLWEDRHE